MPTFSEFLTSGTVWFIAILIGIIGYVIKLGISGIIVYAKEIRTLLDNLVIEIARLNNKNELQDTVFKQLESKCQDCRETVNTRLAKHGVEIDSLSNFKSKVEVKLDI